MLNMAVFAIERCDSKNDKLAFGNYLYGIY